MSEIKIPGYTIIKELGRGGMASVYLAMQESVERKVALKVMLQALAADPSFSERFLREAKIVAQLSHPHIVAVFDVAISGNHHYIAMEFHEGGELKDKIGEGLAIKEVLRITKQMAKALDFAHKKGYVHRDIKPENVLFKSDGDIVLSDFGIARASNANTRMTATGSVIGTPHYMSPEQAQGQELDGRSDLYSLGVVFFEMLVGTVPYKGDSALSVGIKHLRDPIPKLPGQYQMFQTFLDKLMAKEPDNRWQTGADVVKVIEGLELQLGDAGGMATAQNAAIGATIVNDVLSKTAAATQAVPQQTVVQAAQSSESKSSTFKWIISLLVVAGIAGGGFYYMRQKQKAINPASTVATAPEPSVTPQPKKIETLLSEAKQALQTNPSGDIRSREEAATVVEKYREVLKLDPQNATALEGLRQLAGKIIDRANESMGANKLILAAKQLEIAESIDPEHPQLATSQQALLDAQEALKQEATQNQEERQRLAKLRQQREAEQQRQLAEEQAKTKQLTTLLTQADDLLSPYRLTSERINEARSVYRKAFKIAPSDSRVANGDRRVADAYLRLATDMTDQKKYDEAKILIENGLAIIPNHSRLKDLEAYIAKQSEPKKRRSFGGF